ncbi:Alpha/Beta hydrolase protein [Colletotrichum lupini]|nr:Alpha/Beta hydrolase protein [Colletotrichum lupini]
MPRSNWTSNPIVTNNIRLKPAGVGIGKAPPVFLKPGDELAVTIAGLGTLRNRVADHSQMNPTEQKIQERSMNLFRLDNSEKSKQAQFGLNRSIGRFGAGYQRLGVGKDPIILVHGLGGTKDYWLPLITSLELGNSASVHVYDFAGHGHTPTHPLETITVDSLTQDLSGVFSLAEADSGTSPATLIAHSHGCLIAINYALAHPGHVKRLILFGPPPLPLHSSIKDQLVNFAALARTQGLSKIIEDVVATQVSGHTKKTNPLAVAAVRLSLAGQDPEAYAKACSAFASADALDLGELDAETLLITGQDDPVSSPAVVEDYVQKINGSRKVVLPNVGHWHVFEDFAGADQSLREFL